MSQRVFSVYLHQTQHAWQNAAFFTLNIFTKHLLYLTLSTATAYYLRLCLPYLNILQFKTNLVLTTNPPYSKHLLSDSQGCGPQPRAAFGKRRIHHLQQGKQKCLKCLAKKECGRCHMSLSPNEFSLCAVRMPSSMQVKKRRRCNTCLEAHEAEMREMAAMSRSQVQRSST